MSFKVGDKVVYLGGADDTWIKRGAVGTVVNPSDNKRMECDWSKTIDRTSYYWCDCEAVKLIDLSVFNELGD